jgi:hypothetical protein
LDSDALCRLATGGSFAVVLFEASRPILLNGIEDGISRPDLGDRAIFLTLAPIAEMERRPEADLWHWCMAFGRSITFTSSDCRAWLISRSGLPPAKPPFGRPALWRASMAANRTAAIESIIEADPLATACARSSSRRPHSFA